MKQANISDFDGITATASDATTGTEPASTDAPQTRPELLSAAAEYAETVDIDVNLSRVDWELNDRRKTAAATIKTRLRGGEIVGDVTISLTWPAFEANGWEEMKGSIRHELVHLWEYENFGESSHYSRFKRKAASIDAPIHCSQFVDHRYELDCDECGSRAGGRHKRSKVVQTPEFQQNTECPCDAGLRVTDTKTGKTWTDYEGFKAAYPDADDLDPAFRYKLSCATCGDEFTTRKQASKPVKYPARYGSGECDCGPGLEVIDARTGQTWTSHDGYQSR